MHPLDLFKYCPVCGSPRFSVHNEKSKQCEDCGFTYYLNPSAATVAVIVNYKNEVLVVRRGKEPAKGTLDLPGGFSDMGETSEEGVVREVMEETGLTVTKVQFLFSLPNKYEFSGLIEPTMDMFYRCEIEDFSPLAAHDDVAESMFIPACQLDPEKFGLLSIKKGIAKVKQILTSKE